MRIFNLTPNARHFSYAGTMTGGRTIKPGESSRELPFETLLIPLVQEDVKKGQIAVRLDDADRAVIDHLFAMDKLPIKVQKLPKKTKPKITKKAEPKVELEPAVPKNDPKTPKGQPDISSVPPSGAGGNDGPKDISSLMRHNSKLGGKK